jgi:hypothetical protein
MRLLEILIQLLIEVGRTAIVEELSERFRHVHIRRLKGIGDVKRHIHHRTRRRLLNRLSTETRVR